MLGFQLVFALDNDLFYWRAIRSTANKTKCDLWLHFCVFMREGLLFLGPGHRQGTVHQYALARNGSIGVVNKISNFFSLQQVMVSTRRRSTCNEEDYGLITYGQYCNAIKYSENRPGLRSSCTNATFDQSPSRATILVLYGPGEMRSEPARTGDKDAQCVEASNNLFCER